jgi:hypothetical protein
LPGTRLRQVLRAKFFQHDSASTDLFTAEQRTLTFWKRIMTMRRDVMTVLVVMLAVPSLLQANESTMSPARGAAQQMYNDVRSPHAAAAAAKLCTTDVAALAACELQTSALHFMIRRGMGDASDRKRAFAACRECPDILADFLADTKRSTDVARTRLKSAPDDEETRFLLGKLDLNYVWLQLGTLGRKTGWDEYWEARHSLDDVLEAEPGNVRAKVARAWVDYIVDTKVPRGVRWVLGGGSKKRGLAAVREAASAEGATFVRAEAGFALWEMQLREKDIVGARVTATQLASDFPANPDLKKFLDAHAVLASD